MESCQEKPLPGRIRGRKEEHREEEPTDPAVIYRRETRESKAGQVGMESLQEIHGLREQRNSGFSGI